MSTSRSRRKLLGVFLLLFGLNGLLLMYLAGYADQWYWFVGKVAVRNDTQEALVVTPVGRTMGEGPRVGVTLFRSPGEWLPRTNPHYRIGPGETVEIRYDDDSTIMTELAVSPDYKQMVVVPRPLGEGQVGITDDTLASITDDVYRGALLTESKARPRVPFIAFLFPPVSILVSLWLLFKKRDEFPDQMRTGTAPTMSGPLP